MFVSFSDFLALIVSHSSTNFSRRPRAWNPGVAVVRRLEPHIVVASKQLPDIRGKLKGGCSQGVDL